MNYRNIIFDLDGTLTNPYLGILNSLQYALRQLKYSSIPDTVPSEFVGPPLQSSFKEIYGLNEKHTNLAVEYFREYYGKAGLYENDLYEGISELFENLYEGGFKIFIATSKYKKYAQLIIEHFELDKYITELTGADYNGSHSKTELIVSIIDKYQIERSETIMVGDTHFDLVGANEANIDSVAVGYGYGEKENLLIYNPNYYFETVDEMSDLFIGFY